MTSHTKNNDTPENMPQIVEPVPEYAAHFSEKGFWNKLRVYAVRAGHAVVYRALVLYYVLADSETPYWARSVIISALGYFILPIDLIPDFIPVAGFTDDLGALVSALFAVSKSVNDEHRKKAAVKMNEWFPVELVAKGK